MSGKDLFGKPFDDGTIDKLQIFEDYFKEWLPVFLALKDPIWKEIQIFDLFAGEGKDSNGVYGSPMRILSILNDNKALILASNIKIRVIINEFKQKKYSVLLSNLKSIEDSSLYELKCYNDDFNVIFNKYYNSMRGTANFLFLDQNGIKQITNEVFLKLISLFQTDILFFISSSYIKRFAENEEFKKYLKLTRQDFEGKSYFHIHRIILSYYRSLIPNSKKYYLAPFSIKKPTGIYGLIFGSNHTYGLEKFLNVCWKHDKLTGEANFDIDNEKIDLNKPSLFEAFNIPTKKQVFERDITEKIISGKLRSDVEVYLFALDEGFLPRDCNKILKNLKESGKITYSFKLNNSRIHKINLPGTIKLL